MMKYRKEYKYQLAARLEYQTEIFPKQIAQLPRVQLERDGLLTIYEGFAWDGCSGPVIDRPRNQRAGCIHDALYLLMRAGQLAPRYWRAADGEFGKVLITAGNPRWLVSCYLKALASVKGKHAKPENRKKVYENKF